MTEFKKVYGIDLGTTYSCIAKIDEHNKAVVMTNSEGERITPSVVYFEDGGNRTNVIVGTAAKENSKLYPNDVVSFVKRQMGTDYVFEHSDEEYRAEVISSLILKKLAKDAEEHTGEKVEDVVITVPAYFGLNERQATERAGEIAGLNVLDIINEPTAAAISYGITKNVEKKVLVYDLGGGTFDVTLIDISESGIEVVVTGGDQNLGGKNWDDEIIKYLAEQYKEQTGKDEDILEDAETARDLELNAENAKKTLSKLQKAPIRFNHGIDSVRVELTREKFEEITAHLLERTIELTNLMLADAKRKGEGKDAFDEIVLVGGSTRMPQIEARLIREFNVQPVTFDPDEAVAKGAALYAMQKAIGKMVDDVLEENPEKGEGEAIGKVVTTLPPGHTEETVKESIKRKIINVTSKSFGVVANCRTEEGEKVRRVVNLIYKNDALPKNVTRTFGTTDDDQETVLLDIREDEYMDEEVELEDARTIGNAILELPAGLSAGAPIEVTFTLDESGRLEVTGIEVTEKRTVNITIETTSVITKEEVEEAKKKTAELQII
ncbi:Hsp70 family protein [Bacillus wiedmannii]|uniref:Hsp70 family protein n=1 Tax=Bacillus wiedmannii TaxID=1890302 RepID=UPI003D972E9E